MTVKGCLINVLRGHFQTTLIHCMTLKHFFVKDTNRGGARARGRGGRREPLGKHQLATWKFKSHSVFN